MTLRILYVINSLGTGGAERSLEEMLPQLRDLGFDPTVACLYRRPEGVEQRVLAEGVDVRFVRPARLPSRVSALRRLIKEKRPHLVHTTLFEANAAGRLASVGAHTPVLTSLVNTPYEPIRLADPRVSARALRVVRTFDAWTSRHLTAQFHAITHAVKDAAVRDLRIPPDRITVIERGRDPSRLGAPSAQRRERSRRALGLRDDEAVVVTAGRQEYQKGQAFLLEALRLLLNHHPNTVLLIAGRSGRATTELQRLARASDARIRFLGHREDLPEVLAAGDVFAFPSLFEGLGGVLIEAMALGLPIVASDIPALREVVEDGRNADLVPPGSAGPLAAALGSLLSDRDRMRRYGVRSRSVFEQRFTLQRSTDRMAELYVRVVDGRPAREMSAR